MNSSGAIGRIDQFDPRLRVFLQMIKINCFFLFPKEFEFEQYIFKYGSCALILYILDFPDVRRIESTALTCA